MRLLHSMPWAQGACGGPPTQAFKIIFPGFFLPPNRPPDVQVGDAGMVGALSVQHARCTRRICIHGCWARGLRLPTYRPLDHLPCATRVMPACLTWPGAHSYNQHHLTWALGPPRSLRPARTGRDGLDAGCGAGEGLAAGPLQRHGATRPSPFPTSRACPAPYQGASSGPRQLSACAAPAAVRRAARGW